MEIEVSTRIALDGLRLSQISSLKNRCTVRNPAYDLVLRFSRTGGRYTTVPEHLFIFEEDGDSLLVPRGLNVSTSLPPRSFLRKNVTDSRTGEKVKWPKFLVPPLQSQQELLDAIDNVRGYRLLTGTHLFIAPTGSGKSIAALMAAARWGYRTLILVDRLELIESWKRGIQKALGIPLEDIGIIQQKKFTVGRVVTIASTQTLRKRSSEWPGLWEKIGCLVVDECDLVPSSIFSEVVLNCSSKYLLGITATEKRKDKLHSIMYLCFGRPIHRMPEQVTDTMCEITKFRDIKTEFRVDRTLENEINEKPDNPSEVIGQVGLSKPRNALIEKNVEECVKKGRTVLVATARRNHAQDLFDAFKKKLPKYHPVLMLGGGSNKKASESILSGKSKIVVVTRQLISRGVDFPMLDCLHVAGPIADESSVRQLVGRVRRAHPGKDGAWIFDYVDSENPMLSRQYYRHRVPVYRMVGVKKFKNLFYA